MADIDRVCGWCGTPVSDYDVSCEELPKLPDLPRVPVDPVITKAPRLEVIEGQQMQYESVDNAVPDTGARDLAHYTAEEYPEEVDPYQPTDEARRSRSFTIEDVPAVETEQRQTRQLVILSIIAAVLVAIAAIIFFVFKPFDSGDSQPAPTPQTAVEETVADVGS